MIAGVTVGKNVWFKDVWTAVKIMGAIAALFVLPQSIATVAYVDRAKGDMVQYVDVRHEAVNKQLTEIKESQKVIESRMYEILRELKRR